MIESKEYLFSFGADSFYFKLAIENLKIKNRIIKFPVVMYVFGTWSLIFLEER